MSAALTGTGTLLRLAARRDRVRLPLWLLGLSAFVPYLLIAYRAIFATPADLVPIALLLSNPAVTIFTGPGYGLDAPVTELTHPLIFASVYSLYLMVLVALMNILLVTRHTRLEEQTGRAELVRANVVGRHAPLAAALTLAAVANLIVGGAITAALIAFDADPASSLLLGVATAALGLLFAGICAVTAQLTAFSSTSSGLAGAVLAAAFVVRGVGDMAAGSGEHGTWVSWLSPLAWTQQTRAFHDDRWWPVVLLVGTAVGSIALAFALSSRRDVGAGVIQPRRGSAAAPAWLAGPVALAWRLQRSQAFWWAVGVAAVAFTYGWMSQAIVAAFDELPDVIRNLMGGSSEAIAGFLTLILTMLRIFTSIFVVVAWQRVAAEETGGRAENVLATRVRPATWLASHLLIVAAVAVGMLLLSAAVVGGVAGWVNDDPSTVARAIPAAAAGIPAVLMVLTLATLLHALAPRLVALAWAPVVLGALIELFGELLQLPDWARQLSPFEHTPRMPAEDFAAWPVAAQLLIAVVFAVAALWAFPRRDIPGH